MDFKNRERKTMEINFQDGQEALTNLLKGKIIKTIIFNDDYGENLFIIIFEDNSQLVISSYDYFKEIIFNSGNSGKKYIELLPPIVRPFLTLDDE